MNKRLFWLSAFLVCFLSAKAQLPEQENTPRLSPDNRKDLMSVLTDSVKPAKENFIKRFIRAFNEMDTTYIQPNKYNWAVMFQNTNAFESYTIKETKSHQSITFSPKPGVRIGPYLGWRWLFFGYTFDISSLWKGHKSTKTEFELSLYSSMLMCDLIYRRTGDDFQLRRLSGFDQNVEQLEGKYFNGVRSNTIGINAYYIFNHKRFSYPAAYAQSTVQKKSCGTWKAGFSFDLHELNFDYRELPENLQLGIQEKLSAQHFAHSGYRVYP